ncbi:hypothetical protein SRABI70_02946 [Pseudomonas sp. Bi70]|nr:hypothetical protein SRABI70_02946 [Pseudomonas sp. Bi70]
MHHTRGQQIERVGIPYLGTASGRRCRQQAAAPGALAKPRADDPYGDLFSQNVQLIGRGSRQAHHLGQPGLRGSDMLGTGGQRHHAGASAQRALRREQRRTTGSLIAADHQQMAKLTLVGGRLAGWHPRQKITRQAPCSGLLIRDDLRVGLQ